MVANPPRPIYLHLIMWFEFLEIAGQHINAVDVSWSFVQNRCLQQQKRSYKKGERSVTQAKFVVSYQEQVYHFVFTIWLSILVQHPGSGARLSLPVLRDQLKASVPLPA